jgi:hypothetical protein
LRAELSDHGCHVLPVHPRVGIHRHLQVFDQTAELCRDPQIDTIGSIVQSCYCSSERRVGLTAPRYTIEHLRGVSQPLGDGTRSNKGFDLHETF